MAGEPDPLERLREALSELAAREVPALVYEATEVARERVRELLTEAMSESLLAAVQVDLDRNGGTSSADGQNGAPVGQNGAAVGENGAAVGENGTAHCESRAADRGTRAAHGAHPDPEGTAVYVYGVVAASDARRADLAPAGGDHRPLRAVIDGELAALTAQVPLSEFDEARLREHLADMGWVEATARHHEDVLEAIGAAATVVPMRMCTVYGSERGVRELLRRESRPLSDALRYLTGRREWGVKVFCDPRTTAADGAPADERGPSGADYIHRRLRERDERAGASELIEEATDRIHEQLCTVAVDSHLAPVQRPEMSGRTGEMVLNGVYLVGVEAEPRFHAQVRALGQEFAPLGLDLEATGPWPAYNFIPGTIGAAW